MAKPNKLSDENINKMLIELNSNSIHKWIIRDNTLFKSYKFVDFVDAFGFMSRCAMISEKLNHHPEWFNVYNLVEVSLTTHEVSGLSEMDFKLANIMDGYSTDRY